MCNMCKCKQLTRLRVGVAAGLSCSARQSSLQRFNNSCQFEFRTQRQKDTTSWSEEWEKEQPEEEQQQAGTLTGQAPETAARGSQSFVRRRLLLQPLLLHVACCGPKAKPTQRGSQTVGEHCATGLFASCLICAQSAAAAVRVSIRRFRAGQRKAQTIPKPSRVHVEPQAKRFGPQLGLRSSLEPRAWSLVISI